MAPVAKSKDAPVGVSKLTVPREGARERIADALEEGRALASEVLAVDLSGAEGHRSEVVTWSEVTEHLLRTLFDTGEEAAQFSKPVRLFFYMGDEPQHVLTQSREDAAEYVRRLDSLLRRLDHYAEPSPGTPVPVPSKPAKPALTEVGDAVFIVHGHDLAVKHETARLLEKLKLRAVILDEQPNRGRTIIEKFEEHAGECSAAVVLLTPDDLGRAKDGEERPRARQNVVFELGYFMAKLGRGRVCALHAGGLELPSDIQGVIWVSLDDRAWTFLLAKELRDAGLAVDLNLLALGPGDLRDLYLQAGPDVVRRIACRPHERRFPRLLSLM